MVGGKKCFLGKQRFARGFPKKLLFTQPSCILSLDMRWEPELRSLVPTSCQVKVYNVGPVFDHQHYVDIVICGEGEQTLVNTSLFPTPQITNVNIKFGMGGGETGHSSAVSPTTHNKFNNVDMWWGTGKSISCQLPCTPPPCQHCNLLFKEEGRLAVKPLLP